MTSLSKSAHTLVFLNTCQAVHCLLWYPGPAFSSLKAGLSTCRKANATDLTPRATESSVFFTSYLEDDKEDHTVHYSLIH